MFDVLKRKLHNTILRARIKRINDETHTQSHQISLRADQVRDGAEHLQNYGFTHHPPTDAGDALVLCPNGDSEQALVVIVNDRRYRMKGLASGEVAIYDDQAQAVALKRDGIHLMSAKAVFVKAPKTTIDGDLAVTGKTTAQALEATAVNASGDVKAGTVSLRAHTHSGVQNGMGTSGPPQ